MIDPHGIIPPLVTPLLDEDTLDVEGLDALIEHVVEGGVHGIFLLGTTGEGPSLSYELRTEVIERACTLVEAEFPVLVGITDSSIRQAVRTARTAEEAGADAAVLAPPFYYAIRQDELIEFVTAVVDRIELPVFLYNHPGCTGVNFELDTVETLVDRPRVVGFKDSSGDGTYFHELRRLLDRADVPLLVGPEQLLAESLIMGADGGVSGGANAFPELYVAIYESVTEGDLERATRLQDRVMDVRSAVYGGSRFGNSSVIGGIKTALSALGVCEPVSAPPLSAPSEERTRTIETFVAREAERITSTTTSPT